MREPMKNPRTFTSQDGTPIACFASGHGPPLVLFHGTSADHARWTPVLPALEARFTVYACDRRGRGASGDAKDYAVEREVEDVVAVVDGIGGPVNVLGHSFGALLSLEASARAKNIRRLAIYEPPLPVPGVVVFPSELVDRLQALLDAGDREGVVTTFLSEVPRVPPEQIALMKTMPAWSARVGAAHTIVRELRGFESWSFAKERLRDVKTKAVVFLGGASPVFFEGWAKAAHEALEGSRLVVFPGQQHVAMDTAPEMFTREVIAFFES